MNDTAWTDWNRDAEDRIPAIGERVRIWHPLRGHEVVVSVTEHNRSGRSFSVEFANGRRMSCPPMTLVKRPSKDAT
jgi:hypothetical protein